MPGQSPGTSATTALLAVAFVLALVTSIVQRRQFVRLRRRQRRLIHELAGATKAKDAVADELADLRAQHAQADADRDRLNSVTTQLRDTVGERETEVERLRSAALAHDAERAQLRDALAERDEALRQLRSQLDATADQVEQAERRALARTPLLGSEAALPWADLVAAMSGGAATVPARQHRRADSSAIVATVRAALEPRGLIEVEQVIYPAVWVADGPPPRRGPVRAEPSGATGQPWRVYDVVRG